MARTVGAVFFAPRGLPLGLPETPALNDPALRCRTLYLPVFRAPCLGGPIPSHDWVSFLPGAVRPSSFPPGDHVGDVLARATSPAGTLSRCSGDRNPCRI